MKRGFSLRTDFFAIWGEYATAGLGDFRIGLRAVHRGPEKAPLWILPTLWFRNMWSWGEEGATRPETHLGAPGQVVVAYPWELPERHFYALDAKQ